MIDVATLRGFESLRDYSDHDLEILLGAGRACRFSSGTALFEEGRPANACFFLVTGEVEVVRATPDGPRVTGRQGAGMIVGHMALVERGPRGASVHAVTDVTALEFTRDVFDTLLEASSPFAIRFQEQIAVVGIRQLRRATAQLINVLTSAESQSSTSTGTRDALRYLGAATGEWSLPVPRHPKE